MRIGILTLPLHTNYGGILQAYALQTVLERMGHDVVVIEQKQRSKANYWNMFFQFIPRVYKRKFLKKDIQLLPEIYERKFEPVIRKNTNAFIKKHLHIKSDSSYMKVVNSNNLDCIVVGSDQVWRPLYVENIDDFFVGFDPTVKVKRISYAASFGVDKWEFTDEQTKACSNLIRKFAAVSVREKIGVDFCKKYFGVNAIQVLDPTMLLGLSDYVKLAEIENKNKSSGNLFCYILDETSKKDTLINNVARLNGLTPFYTKAKEVASLKKCMQNINDCVIPDVSTWIQSFIDAEMVITDSFHGCVFSIIFNKPFWAFINPERGTARFDSLLSLFNLKDRIISVGNDFSQFEWKKAIDWDSVNHLKKMYEDKSIGFLSEQLNC